MECLFLSSFFAVRLHSNTRQAILPNTILLWYLKQCVQCLVVWTWVV